MLLICPPMVSSELAIITYYLIHFPLAWIPGPFGIPFLQGKGIHGPFCLRGVISSTTAYAP